MTPSQKKARNSANATVIFMSIVLIKEFKTLGVDHGELSDLARTLRSLSGLYDQTARAATSF